MRNTKTKDQYKKCFLCNSIAVAMYYFDKGCMYNKQQVQCLCEYHIHKARPLGSMVLLRNTINDFNPPNTILFSRQMK